MAETSDAVDLTDTDKANMRTFLKQIYARNPDVVDRWRMNERVFDIVSDMIVEVVDCSDHMDLVPRPTDLVGARGGIRYVKQVLQRIAKRVQRNQMSPDRRMYISCRDFVAANYRSHLELAGAGL